MCSGLHVSAALWYIKCGFHASSHGEENLFTFKKKNLNFVSCTRPADYSSSICQSAQNISELEPHKFVLLIFVQQSGGLGCICLNFLTCNTLGHCWILPDATWDLLKQPRSFSSCSSLRTKNTSVTQPSQPDTARPQLLCACVGSQLWWKLHSHSGRRQHSRLPTCWSKHRPDHKASKTIYSISNTFPPFSPPPPFSASFCWFSWSCVSICSLSL